LCASVAHHSDILYANRSPANQFDVIDLDPYGSATTFLDGAIQSVRDGGSQFIRNNLFGQCFFFFFFFLTKQNKTTIGLLMVTCTDLVTLAGNNPDMCFAKYGSAPVRTKACHELGALRLCLSVVAASFHV
jgi:tRNA (guanine26-N2/guanine27-N2)-dimethyltransferase